MGALISETEDTTKGHYEYYEQNQIGGWAFDTTAPDDPVIVELSVDGEPVSTVAADLFRPHLLDAGMGNGKHGFQIEIPARFFDSAPHQIDLRLKPSGRGIENTPPLLIFGDRPSPAAQQRSRSEVVRPSRTPKISLILPTFNRGAVLERTVRRYAKCAEWEAAELIIVDDGSRDDTSQRVRALCQEHANIVTATIPNSGPGTARNLAAGLAKAPLLLFIGDDVEPLDDNFLATHLTAHEAFPDRGTAVLGKIVWPQRADVNFVMQHVQGDGQQQFGFKFMEPYKRYDWRFFYSSNVSIKRSLISDWTSEGYDAAFNLAAFEDGEFAYRVTRRLQSVGQRFEILYVPAATLRHDHPYTVASFMRRQVACGMMARVFFEKHPEIASEIGLSALNEALREAPDGGVPVDHYMTVFEGLKSWALIVEKLDSLGSQNWHGDLLSAVFELGYFEGYLRTIVRSDANVAAGARWLFERVTGKLKQAAFRELLGPGFGEKLGGRR